MVYTPRRLGACWALLAFLFVLNAVLLAQNGAYAPSATPTGAPGNSNNVQPNVGSHAMPGSYMPQNAPGAAANGPASPKAATPQNTSSVADQYPPRPPRVSFRNGQLSINAENSTLPDILAAIHQRTGAAMELPTTLGSERVAAKLGPAATDQVLAALLNGSHFDYIVLNRPGDPSSPERIILREKVGADANAANNGYNNMTGAQPAYQSAPETQEMPETIPEEEGPQPHAAPGGAMGENPGNIKTPEQLLEELQQMKQRRQQAQPPEPQPQLLPQQPPLVDNNTQQPQ